MSTGLSSPIETLIQNIPPIQNTIYGILLILIIVYVHLIPSDVRKIADSLSGRFFGVIGLGLTVRYVGWVYGLLYAMAFLLLIHSAPRSAEEGFNNMMWKNVERPKSRWFVERVFGERPIRIERDTVITEAVQD
jgi:hypothetical protein